MVFRSILLALAYAGIIQGAPKPLRVTEDIDSFANWTESVIPTGSSKYAVGSLPDNPPIPPSWAGRIGVPGAAEGNEIFFWLFEPEDKAYDDHLISEFARKPPDLT